jgi:hypothetical protein
MNDDLDQFEDMELFQYDDEPVEAEAAPAPAPAPEPAPEVAPAPSGNTENWSNEVLNRMGYHLRKRERYGITVEQAVEKILTDSATHDEYKKLNKETQKFSGM